MSKPIDLTGQKFNHWTVIERAQNNKRGEAMWLCECDCPAHTKRAVQSYSLRKGLSKSCGCVQKQKASKNNFIDISGHTFGHLKVIEFAGRDSSRKLLWKCVCDCPSHTIIITRGTDLRSGKTKSCGCIRSRGEELISKLLTENNIPFVKEKTFDTCRFPNTNALARFDFYVDNKYLIEFDGQQHTDSNNGWYTKERAKKDLFKENWCKENNIPLIRIPYNKLTSLRLEDLIC